MIPVAVALMTPIPLLVGFTVKKLFKKTDKITEVQDPAAETMIKDECEVTITSPNSVNETERP